MEEEITLKILKDKIVNRFDFDFMKSIQCKLPCNNAYFWVCLTETIYNSEENTLEHIIDRAYQLYRNTDISSYLNNCQHGTC